MTIDAREYGKLEAEVEQLKDIVNEIRSDLKEVKKDWHEARGGVRILIGAAAVIGAIATQAFNWILNKV